MILKMETKRHTKLDRFYLSLAKLIGLHGENERELSDIARDGTTGAIAVASGTFISGTFAFLISQTEYLGPFPSALELSAMGSGIAAVGVGIWRIYQAAQKYRRQALDYRLHTASIR